MRSAEKSSFDPFGLSLDDETDDSLDISVDDMGAQPVELTLEPPPRLTPAIAEPAPTLATPLEDLATPLEELAPADEVAALELSDAIDDDVPTLSLNTAPASASAPTPTPTPSPVLEPAAPAAAPIAAPASAANNSPDKAVISAAVREMIEQIVWEVVPELAETMIREELDRLLRERGVQR